tara:strand:- start:655 stop:1188 length:534 start_codon:yes stop_codon:yes gene_type:complete
MNKWKLKQVIKEEIAIFMKESSVENKKSDTLLYHGTTLNRAKKILRESEQRSSVVFLYLADTEEAVEQYSYRAVEDEEAESNYEIAGEGCIIIISLAALQKNQQSGIGELMNDYDDIWSLYKNGQISTPPSQVSWGESLELLGTCSYKGSLYKSIISLKLIETGEEIFPSRDKKSLQ